MRTATLRFEGNYERLVNEALQQSGLTMTQLIRNAINTYATLLQEKSRGGRIYVRDNSDGIKELILP